MMSFLFSVTLNIGGGGGIGGGRGGQIPSRHMTS